jgi:DNA-binding LacI/PurR family transcriptional regulator
VSLHGNDSLPEHIQRTGTPAVLGGRPTRPLDMSYVDVDNKGGARDAVLHLIERGRTKIATIAGPADMAVGLDRLAGYRDALRGARLRAGRELTEHGDFSQDSGFAAMRTLLERAPHLDAVFAASDLMAAGAMRALKAAGRSVPADVAVVGFDDSLTAQYTEPPLTTVRQPLDQMGRQMTELLIDEINDPAATRRAVILNTELVVRGSS